MDIVKEHWLAGETSATLTEIAHILQQEDDTIPGTDSLLLFANIYYQLGILPQACKLIRNVKFDTSDLRQWIVENNTLVLKYLESKGFEEQRSVTLSFGVLHEKLEGLPFPDVCLLELNVCLNYALVVLCSTSQQTLVPGGYRVSHAILLRTLNRVCANQDHERRQWINQSFEEKLRFYFKNGREQNQEELNVVATLVLLLASNFLVNSQASEAHKLIGIVLDLYQPNFTTAENVDVIFTLMENARKGQECLLPACHLLCCYSLFILKKKTEAFKHCDQCLSLKSDFVSGLFMKGLLLYESGKHEDAIRYLQETVALSKDNSCKATALNLLGCICAKLGKPHTAILKFRESFASHAGHLEALYNVAVVYNDVGEPELEMSLWKYILKILSLESCYVRNTAVKTSMDYICGITARTLSDSISQDTFLLSTDIYCAQRCNFRNSKLSTSFILFKIAHTCLKLKRYSEASEFFGELLAQLNDRPVNLQECGLPSMVALHKEFAEALFNCDRWDDCLVVCERILNHETVSMSKTLFSQDTAKSDMGLSLIEIMLCKAVAFKELQRPVEANECYESILDAINKGTKNCPMGANTDEPKEKRPKLELGKMFS